MQRIASLDDIAAGLDALCLLDPRLEKVRGMAGEVPLRLSEPGFGSLASIIVSQQVAGGLDLHHLCSLDADEAIAAMTAVPGIGPWTAECYLLFAAGHPDVFPARDVALQTAVGHALGIDPRPPEKTLIRLAESWSPWRGVASRLFWAYYRELKGRDAAPPVEMAEKA
ncbi:MAG: DNA-3-methyladenine glycosylase 2 family protein [Mesorhizobium sp.]|nr:MAG: DNA-3-methyladenine glycosylase 2 family protein [Mesorhizobium sp.]